MNDKNQDVFAMDGDTLAYRTAAVCEDHFEGSCDAILATTLKTIATDTGISNFRIYISGKDNFRYKVGVTKEYKGNRATMVRPKFLQYCKDWLVKNRGAIVVDGFEADDAIATDMVKNGAIHCGVDKDIFQIAGRHYNYTKENPDERWVTITPEEATLNLWRQVLTGDTSDNIPGLPGIGKAKAESAIQCAETAEDDAIAFYRDVCAKKLPDVNYLVYMAEQLSLVRMVTDVPQPELPFTFVIEPETAGFTTQEGEPVQTEEVQQPTQMEFKM